METLSSTLNRTEAQILSAIKDLTAESGFIYTFSLMMLKYLCMTIDEIANVNWYDRPNNREMSLILGLLVTNPLNLHSVPSEQTAADQDRRACHLLNELHQHHTFPPPSVEITSESNIQNSPNEYIRLYDSWASTGESMIEPMFYEGEGAYEFQHLDFAAARYSADSSWLLTYLGTSFESIIQTAKRLQLLARQRIGNLHESSSFEDFCEQALAAMSFDSTDFPPQDQINLNTLTDRFVSTPGPHNTEIKSINQFSAVNTRPIIDLGNGRYFLPLFPNLAQAIYEGPFYWTTSDPAYRDISLKHRGEATEEITYELLAPLFPNATIYRDVKVKIGPNDLTDIDVLAVSGNKAIIVQCKSKKLTLNARAGNLEQLASDFAKAVQEPYEQGLLARNALLEQKPSLIGRDGRTINLRHAIDDAYIVCITGDHYPALTAQANRFLNIEDDKPYPVIMTIFDLDVATFYLNDRFEFLYYLRQRSKHATYFYSTSEISILAFHLKHKLYPDQDYTAFYVDPAYSQLLDANFVIANSGRNDRKTRNELFGTWKNQEFDRIVKAVKSAAVQQPGQALFEDLLFFLFDIVGRGADDLTRPVDTCKRQTRIDGQWHDARIIFQHPTAGITFVSFPKVLHPIQRELLTQDFFAIAAAHKYLSKADQWFALASFENNPDSFELFGYMNDPWQYDPESDRAVNELVTLGKSLDPKGKSKKIGRNHRCPCGSQQKFKRCHGR